MKINTRICDICGKDIHQHGRHEYTIKKKFWEYELIGKRLDLCEECWNRFLEWFETTNKINKLESK